MCSYVRESAQDTNAVRVSTGTESGHHVGRGWIAHVVNFQSPIKIRNVGVLAHDIQFVSITVSDATDALRRLRVTHVDNLQAASDLDTSPKYCRKRMTSEQLNAVNRTAGDRAARPCWISRIGDIDYLQAVPGDDVGEIPNHGYTVDHARVRGLPATYKFH